MAHPRSTLILLSVPLLGAGACLASTAAGPPPPAPRPGALAHRLREVAARYRRFSPVYRVAKWAPTMCAPPPPVPRLSRATGGGAHARKLYYLFAGSLRVYQAARSGSGGAQPVGQVLVKESWVPRRVEGSAHAAHPALVKRGHDAYLPGSKGPLFVMLKLEPATPETDQGWVYGTLTPDGRKVTSVGRVEACMACHRQGTHDRVFGPYGAMSDPTLPVGTVHLPRGVELQK